MARLMASSTTRDSGTEGLLANMHNSQIEELLRINVTAPIILTKYVVRQMMAARRRPRRQYFLDHRLDGL